MGDFVHVSELSKIFKCFRIRDIFKKVASLSGTIEIKKIKVRSEQFWTIRSIQISIFKLSFNFQLFTDLTIICLFVHLNWFYNYILQRSKDFPPSTKKNWITPRPNRMFICPINSNFRFHSLEKNVELCCSNNRLSLFLIICLKFLKKELLIIIKC